MGEKSAVEAPRVCVQRSPRSSEARKIGQGMRLPRRYAWCGRRSRAAVGWRKGWVAFLGQNVMSWGPWRPASVAAGEAVRSRWWAPTRCWRNGELYRFDRGVPVPSRVGVKPLPLRPRRLLLLGVGLGSARGLRRVGSSPGSSAPWSLSCVPLLSCPHFFAGWNHPFVSI